MNYNSEDVLNYVEEEDVKFIRLTFFDVYGKQKNISIMADELPRAFSEGIAFDASSITGFEDSNDSDLFLHPDPTTLVVLPWRPSHGRVVCMFCDIKYPDGTSYKKDSRKLLKNAIEKAKQSGIEFYFGSEMEFYLFKLDENGNPLKEPLDNATYMDIAPEDKGENVRRDICFTLEAMEIYPESSHHEEGPGQNEIDFKYSKALKAADNTEMFKWIVRTKANSNGLFADFSPKPLKDKSGNGFHINISCKKIGSLETAMPQDLQDKMVAGILSHMAEITLFLNPSQDSYNRLGECKAPKYINYGLGDRTKLIRIPKTAENSATKRIEVRSADPSANPYLAFALLICSALDGITNNMTLTEQANSKVLLPDTFEDAVKEARNSSFVKSVVGEDFLNAYCK